MDPFDTLGLPPRFALDLHEAEKRVRDLSRAMHPDRYVGRPAGERRMALSKAIEINAAWRILKDPVKRAEALFRRAGVPAGEGKDPPADPELLMEMMEQREALSEARAARDRAKLGALVGGMRQRQARVLAALGEALDGGANLASKLGLLGELRYVRRFLDEASAAEDEIG